MKPLHALAAATVAAFSSSAQAVGTLADLALHDRVTGAELPIHWHEGRAHAAGTVGHEYQVVLRNRAGQPLLGVVSVDGVNVVDGATADTGQRGYVLLPGERLDIRGWRKGDDEIASFHFTPLPESYAALTGRPANVGVIGVALYKRRSGLVPVATLAGSAPDGESSPKLAHDHSETPLGTGHGRREASQVRRIPFERATREPVEIITIHYDTHLNLVRRGVMPDAPAPPSS
jgi:hypothetical protein